MIVVSPLFPFNSVVRFISALICWNDFFLPDYRVTIVFNLSWISKVLFQSVPLWTRCHCELTSIVALSLWLTDFVPIIPTICWLLSDQFGMQSRTGITSLILVPELFQYRLISSHFSCVNNWRPKTYLFSTQFINISRDNVLKYRITSFFSLDSISSNQIWGIFV